MSDFFNEREVKKIHKARRCEWCGQWINKGGRAFHHWGYFDGAFFDNRIHPECREAMGDSDLDGEGYMPYSNDRGLPD